MADTTLSALFPGIPFTVAGERVSLTPICLADLPAVERVMGAWKIMIATAGQVLDPEAWADFLVILASAAGRPVAWVEALPEDAFRHLVAGAIAINADIVEPGSGSSSGESLTWSRIMAKLVQAGHPWETIQRMTLSQARQFLEEAYRQDREALAANIVASNYAMADGKAVAKITQELNRG